MCGNNENSGNSLSVKELLIGGIIGGLIGGTAALLLAPKSGAETRQSIHVRELLNTGVDRIKQATSTLIQKDDEPFS